MEKIEKHTELRKLPAWCLISIVNILETDGGWKKVMSLIPRNPRSEYFEAKYNNEHIKQIEDHAQASKRTCAEIMFEEWGTSGRVRPTLATLKDIVQKAEIYRAADELAEMMQESLPTRPQDGPAAIITMTDLAITDLQSGENGTTAQMRSSRGEQPSVGHKTTVEMKSDSNAHIPNFSEFMLSEKEGPNWQQTFPNIDFPDSNTSGIDTAILRDDNLIHFPYKDLERITKRFSENIVYTPVSGGTGKIAGKVGSGGFGEVYVGFHPDHGHLAVKRARSHLTFDRKPEIAAKVFNAEVKLLAQFRHSNIVSILGYSRDGPALCMVCEYIDGGSLDQKLEAKILTEKQRINIMIGTMEGLRYLHGTKDPSKDEFSVNKDNTTNFVHGDVKSANILLTRDCVPKLCDFGLGKQCDVTTMTSTPMGSFAYMAPEGFGGTVTQKNDIYAFGIVLLEMLTGLKPVIKQSRTETVNIKDYIEENCPNNEITNLLDPFIDKWTKAKEIHALAKKCLVKNRSERPTADYICDTLQTISGVGTETESEQKA